MKIGCLRRLFAFAALFACESAGKPAREDDDVGISAAAAAADSSSNLVSSSAPPPECRRGSDAAARLLCFDGFQCRMSSDGDVDNWIGGGGGGRGQSQPLVISAAGDRQTNFEDLADLGFDDAASSCYFDNGVWLLHEHPGFNSGGGLTLWGWGDRMWCLNFGREMNKRASSVRLVGAPQGYKCSTFNTYEGTYFNGREKFAYDDNHDFAEPGFGQASAIITGCDSWTLYSEPNLRGDSLCIDPGPPLTVDWYGYAKDCKPKFIVDLAKIGGIDFTDRISSVSRGCR